MIGLLFLLLLVEGSIYSFPNPIVNTPLGSIQGSVDHFKDIGKTLYSFTGVPYAQPPTGNLRFKPPVPIRPWKGVYDAGLFSRRDQSCCQSKDYYEHDSTCGGHEDCLNLNIYTHHIMKSTNYTQKPVLVYFHGGNFIYYTGITDGKLRFVLNIVEHDNEIVFVTVNYRLGLFGFFSTGDNHAPGNYGLKDQVEALKWIKNYINYFGGDPSKVTLLGNGFGASLVGLHLVSPMSRGLFHGAMMISGSPINFWSTIKNPFEVAKEQAKQNGCPTDTSKDIADCFARRNTSDKYHRTFKRHGMKYFSKKNELEAYMNWYELFPLNGPVVEATNNGSERFLTKEPIESILEGDIADVPVFIGTTRDEMIDVACDLQERGYPASDLSGIWNTIAPILFQYPRNDTTSKRVREFYFGSSTKNITLYPLRYGFGDIKTTMYRDLFNAGRNDSRDPNQEFSDLLSDSYFNFGVLRFAKLLAEKNTKPVYLYQYNYPGNDNYKNVLIPRINHLAHGEEMVYSFGEALKEKPCLGLGARFWDEKPFVKKYIQLWINFVEEGNPIPKVSAEFDNVTWTPFTKEHPAYLDINTTFTLKDGIYNQERFSFWESIFPLPVKRSND